MHAYANSSILHTLNQVNRSHRHEPTIRDQFICDIVYDEIMGTLATVRALGDLGRSLEPPATVPGLVTTTSAAQATMEPVRDYCRDHGAGERRSDFPSRTDLQVGRLGGVPAVGEALAELLATLASLNRASEVIRDESLAAMVRRMVDQVHQVYAGVAKHCGLRRD